MTEASVYVALGDSYAAGVGGGPRASGCWRADAGYPVLLARTLGLDLAYQACLGATIADVERHQMGALSDATRLVSITLGGNDIGFAPVLISAAEPAWMSDSDTAIDAALVTLRTELPTRLRGLYAAVRERAPQAELVVTTYPRLFNGEDCQLATFFSDHEMTRLNAAADELAAVIAEAAATVGATVVDVVDPFVGHAVCDEDEWVNGVAWPLEGSFHPSAAGHAAYARLVAGAVTVPPSAAAPEPRITHGPEAPGSAPTFRLPDLLSPRSLEGARAHGLDPDEVAALAARTQAGAQTDLAAYQRLMELDAQVRAAVTG
ncbi:MAG: SGNH/GDSL hydrolase family protein [Micrococcales bacterium]|nr:SGNH/GDSL hydrolase family protein [Micrococcales bacterium]